MSFQYPFNARFQNKIFQILKIWKILPLFFISFSILSCQNEPQNLNEEEDTQQFQKLTPTQTGIDFHNKITETEEQNHLIWEAIYNGGGVAIGDINNDDLPDIYFTGNQVSDALYLNKGDLKFEDISTSSSINSKDGWSTGVVMTDVNGDGWLDIYVSRSHWGIEDSNEAKRANLLWINNQDLTFTERAIEYGLNDSGYSTQANFLDYDLDGDLDCYVLNTPSHNFNQKLQYAQNQSFTYTASDHFYRNNGNKFEDITKEIGIEGHAYGLGIVSTDINFDAYPDLYIANDFEKPDRFLINNRDGTFRDEIHQKMKHLSLFSMGVDAADFNQDGYMDIAVLDMQTADHYRAKTNMKSMNVKEFWRNVSKGYHYQYMSNMLQMNRGIGTYFSEIGQMAGIAKTDWSWSILMADFDNDSWTDIYVTNGINKDIRNNDFLIQIEGNPNESLFEKAKQAPSFPIANYAFRNKGDLTFEDASNLWHLDQKGFSHGAAYGDLDNDGDLDLVVNNTSSEAFIFKNNSTNNYLKISILGWSKNTKGIGTKAIIHHGDQKQFQELTPVRGFQSSSEACFHFGLGKYEKVDTVFVIFPDGRMHRLENVKANQTLKLDYQKTNDFVKALPTKKPFFQKLNPKNLGMNFIHKENLFNDFDRESLLPHRQSVFGPKIAVGDVNGDNLEDFFIGGASGQSGQLFIQNSNGSFNKNGSQPWNSERDSEDSDALFFDFDDDKKLDLYVASGGYEFEYSDDKYLDRLYLNNGNGQFRNSNLDIPISKFNGSVVAPNDINGNGKTDLFVGNYGYPGAYPKASHSEILLNENGKFLGLKNLSDELRNVGLVRDAIWADLDDDNQKELIVVGEWMSPTLFKNNSGSLEKTPFQIKNRKSKIENPLSGWWHSIIAEDIDNDGDTDLILGNIGMNNKYQATEKKPLLVYGNDFDNNKTNDVVLAKTSEKGILPVRGRECSSEQMPFIKEKFPTFDEFAKATLPDILGEEKLEEANAFEANEFRSGILKNEGGYFEFIPFPNMVQIAPIMDMITLDLNKDGLKDLICIGNLFGAEVETVRHDANNGLVLINKGNGNFESVPTFESQFYVPGNARSLAKIETPNGTLILVGVNDNQMEVFRVVE